MSLIGKTALVTGAATGIGAAIAKELAASSANVFGADISWNGNEEIPGVERVDCDVTSPSEVDACVARIAAHRGGVDILVNNAALAATLSPKPFEDITPEEWSRVMTVNTLSQFLCSKAVVPHMRERKWGRIVNLTSGTAFVGTPYMLHYTASKGAIIAMTRSLAKEVGGFGITVNAIAPGLTVTEGIRDNSAYSEEMRASVIASRAIAREERAEDLVGTCTFLASEAARFITGQIIVIDGGATFH
jgi:NAD(P)-dependent dehydrogenase (short-subunit alcohol dehydrogenase family)